MPKSFWTSKVLWFNVLAFVILVVNPFGFADFVKDPQLEAYAFAAITVINALLRLATSKPITLALK